MTRSEFISSLPNKIDHWGRGECFLKILEDNKRSKAACYMNKDKFKVGYKKAADFELLYTQIMEYLRKEGLE